MGTSKRPALLALARVFAATGAPYAIIGGIALQVHQTEPRTTVDIDLAVPNLDLLKRGFGLRAGLLIWRTGLVRRECWCSLLLIRRFKQLSGGR